MEKASALLRWTATLLAIVMIFFLIGNPAVFGVKTIPKEGLETRADIIRIDSMRVFGKLDRPPVTFLHQNTPKLLKKRTKTALCATFQKRPRPRESNACPRNICGLKTRPGRKSWIFFMTIVSPATEKLKRPEKKADRLIAVDVIRIGWP